MTSNNIPHSFTNLSNKQSLIMNHKTNVIIISQATNGFILELFEDSSNLLATSIATKYDTRSYSNTGLTQAIDDLFASCVPKEALGSADPIVNEV